MNFKIHGLIFVFVMTFHFLSTAQETWSLERCIQQAQQNSISIKNADLDVVNAKVDERQSKMNQLPNLSFSTTGGLNLGRSVNPATYSFETRTSYYNSLNLSGGVALYNGGKIQHQIQQSKINTQTANADLENISNNISLEVAAAYLVVVNAEEQYSLTGKRIEQVKRQLEQIDKLIAAGSRPQNERLDVLAQLAKAEQNAVLAQNNVNIAYLNLKQMLLLDPDFNMKVQRYEINVAELDPNSFTLSTLYTNAMGVMPSIRAAELRVKSADIGLSIAKAVGRPSLTLGVGVATNYTNLGRTLTGVVDVFSLPINARINSNPAVLEIQQSIPVYQTPTYLNQFKDNLGGGVQLNLNIPIFNNGASRTAKNKAYVALKKAELQNERVRQQLKSDIQKSIADSKAAQKQYEAATKTFEAAKASFENAEKRYKIGSLSTYDYNTSRNNMDTAEVEALMAKYEYIFKTKVLDFYRGRKITINN